MAATTTVTGKCVSVTGIDADWDWTSVASSGAELFIDSITFVPGNAADKISIKNVTAAGAYIMLDKPATTTAVTVYFFGCAFSPVIDFSECTLNTGHAVIFRLR